jgi:uncharacterized membrane protein
MLVVAFGIKAAIFPVSFWLPDSYPTAPAPVTAVFAGLLTKVGVYALIRTETQLFASNSIDTLLLIIALATMIVGVLGAVAQAELKRVSRSRPRRRSARPCTTSSTTSSCRPPCSSRWDSSNAGPAAPPSSGSRAC